MLHIRPATHADVNSIVQLHIKTWKAQFIPFLTPEQVKLKDLDEANQRAVWQGRFENEEGQSRQTFIALQDASLIGYITGRSTSAPDESELHQIYVLPTAHRSGIGRQLVSELATSLIALNKTSLFVWVMTINPAITFYRDHLGGTFVTERIIPDGDGILKEAQYHWDHLEDLVLV